MSVLDFLNLDQFDAPGVPGAVQRPAELATVAQQPVNPAANPAVLIEMAEALKKQEVEAKKTITGNLPVMFDGEGRKLGAPGLLLALQRDLRLARQAGDVAEINRLETLMPEAEAGVEAFVKKSGLSRAQLFPDPVRSKQADQADAVALIQSLQSRCAELHAQAARADKSVTRFKRLLEARTLQGEASLVALSAGLIERSQLEQAGSKGVWNVIDLLPAPSAEAQEQGGEPAQKDGAAVPQERNAP